MECEERERHAIANRIRDAQLPRMKTLEGDTPRRSLVPQPSMAPTWVAQMTSGLIQTLPGAAYVSLASMGAYFLSSG